MVDRSEAGTRQPTIAWDVDDVLNDLMGGWLAWYRERGPTAITYEEIAENPPYRLLGISRDEYLASLDAYRLSDAARGQQPVPEVLAWFEEHGDGAHHIAVTATPLATAPGSAEWVVRHFGRWIRTFHVTPSPRVGDGIAERETKTASLARLGGADMAVDDLPANLEGMPEMGIATLVFPRPWNGAPGTISDALRELTALLDEVTCR